MNEKLSIFPSFSIFLTLSINFISLVSEVLLPSTELSFLTAALWWATPKPFWEYFTQGSVLTVESVALHTTTWSHEWTWLLQIRGGHGLDQCSVPTKTACHELEGGWTPAAVSCGASELWEGTQMWAGRNGLWFQFEGRGKDTFLVVLAASLQLPIPAGPSAGSRTSDSKSISAAAAGNRACVYPSSVTAFLGLQCLLQLAPL